MMMPHAFERLWGAFEPQGEFQTHITESVPQTTVVRHLNDRGFQVTDASSLFGGVANVYAFLVRFLEDGCLTRTDTNKWMQVLEPTVLVWIWIDERHLHQKRAWMDVIGQ